MLEILLVPACFLVAGLLGHRLGTPARVVAGLVALGCAHLLAFLGARQALAADGSTADWIHLASQLLFTGGFVAFVWLAATYPDQRPARAIIAVALGLGAAGPLLAAVSGPTPSVVDASEELGPVVQLVPAGLAGLSAVPLMALPLVAVTTFAVRYVRADRAGRAAMRWPIAGVVLIAALALAGTLLAQDSQPVVTALFLIGAPLFPLAIAFGPVLRHVESLSTELADVREAMSRHARPSPRPGVLATLSPRELTVLESMAKGMSNPLIARTMHLSLSSVEKHATSIFRKLEIAPDTDVHRRVAAVIAYRDALDSTLDSNDDSSS